MWLVIGQCLDALSYVHTCMSMRGGGGGGDMNRWEEKEVRWIRVCARSVGGELQISKAMVQLCVLVRFAE